MKKYCIAVFSFIMGMSVSAQTITLDDAIKTALSNNIQVRQNQLLVDVASVSFSQAKSNRLPAVSAFANHGINQGRSIDPFTNAFVNQSINYAGYGVSSGITLFNGLGMQHSVRQQGASYEASKLELQQTKDNLVLNVVLAYLSVLNAEEQLLSAKEQVTLSQKQLERLEILDKQGAITPSQVFDVRGQLMNDQLAVTDFQNQLQSAKLSLSQLMNVPYNPALRVEKLAASLFEPYQKTGTDVYNKAVEQLPMVKAASLRTRAAEYAWKSARGDLFPAVVLGGNVQTNYSSIAQNSAGKIPYGQQLNNNIFSSVNLGLRIPIFSARQTRHRMKLAELEIQNSELLEENTKLQLRQQVEQAYLNMVNAYNRYVLLAAQVKAFEQSFRAAEARFNAGVGNTIDYLTAKTNVDRANINLINAQYDYLLRRKILEYYEGTSAG